MMTAPVRALWMSASCALCWLLPLSVWAGPFDLYGSGGEDSARALGGAASAAGAHALNMNPAALRLAPDSQVSAGMVIVANQLQILMTPRPAGYDVPDLGDDSPALPTVYERPREDVVSVPPLTALTLSGVSSFGVKRLRVAGSLLLPTDSALTLDTHFADERERYATNQLQFTLLDRRVRRLDLQAGASFEVTSWLALGGALSLAPTAALNNDVTLRDAANQEDAEINLHANTAANLGWSLGAHIDLKPHVRLGLSWRSPLAVEVSGENRITVRGVEDAEGRPQVITQQFAFVPSYTPARAVLGAQWYNARTSVDLDVRYTRWSDYIDTQGQRAGFRDTASLSLSSTLRLHRAHTARLGIGYGPSPVPDQQGRSNYVDNDRLITSIGGGHVIAVRARPVHLDWSLQIHTLQTRTTEKVVPDAPVSCAQPGEALCDEVPDDTSSARTGQPYPEARGLQTGNPGFPGFTSGGWIAALGLRARWGGAP